MIPIFALNLGKIVQSRFWHTYGRAKVDYIQETGASQILAFKFKFNGNITVRSADTFQHAYAAAVELANQESYLEFLLNS